MFDKILLVIQDQLEYESKIQEIHAWQKIKLLSFL